MREAYPFSRNFTAEVVDYKFSFDEGRFIVKRWPNSVSYFCLFYFFFLFSFSVEFKSRVVIECAPRIYVTYILHLA